LDVETAADGLGPTTTTIKLLQGGEIEAISDENAFVTENSLAFASRSDIGANLILEST
jgi:hypothetical protein